mgnify:CR=1 FL=1
MWMLQVCPLSASNSYPSHDIALYKETDGKMADDKTRETLLKAVKARDADAIAKAVKEVNESKTAKEKADAEAKAKAEQEAIRATQGADQGQRIDPISKLPLALAEKLSSRFVNEEDRAKFLEKVQARLSDAPQPEIKIREAVATSKEPKAQAEDMER